MINTALRLALLAASFTAVQAHATTVNFTGVVNYAYGYNSTVPTAGETITGTYTFDANAPSYYSYGDGFSYAGQYASDNSGANALGVSGSAVFSDGTVLSLGTSNIYSYSSQFIYRNYGGYINEAGGYAQTYSTGDYTSNYLQVYAYDYNGISSTLFTDPTAGLSFSQGIDASGAGIYRGGYFEGSSAEGYYYGSFTPTSFSISAVPEASNLALLLSGLGVVGIAARRRQQAARG